MPEAAAWVSVGELRDADTLLSPRELRAMRIWEGLVLIVVVRNRAGSQTIVYTGVSPIIALPPSGPSEITSTRRF